MTQISLPFDEAPTLSQWWSHLERSGVLAAMSQRLPAQDLADFVVLSWQRSLEVIDAERERAAVAAFTAVPYGVA
ncbi:MAG: hypothetical protein R3A52_13750 [Polyangiales bacterium]